MGFIKLYVDSNDVILIKWLILHCTNINICDSVLFFNYKKTKMSFWWRYVQHKKVIARRDKFLKYEIQHFFNGDIMLYKITLQFYKKKCDMISILHIKHWTKLRNLLFLQQNCPNNSNINTHCHRNIISHAFTNHTLRFCSTVASASGPKIIWWANWLQL